MRGVPPAAAPDPERGRTGTGSPGEGRVGPRGGGPGGAGRGTTWRGAPRGAGPRAPAQAGPVWGAVTAPRPPLMLPGACCARGWSRGAGCTARAAHLQTRVARAGRERPAVALRALGGPLQSSERQRDQHSFL